MKKTIIAIVFLMFGLASFGQYTEDKLPSGLTVATTANDADYTIIQKNAESIVKAIRMDSLRSYMTQGMAENIEVLDSVSGQTGQFIISDGVGWLAPVSAKYEGDGAFTFGYRTGTAGWGSFLTGGGVTSQNIASGDFSTSIGGYRNTASGQYSFASGVASVASGNTSFALGYQDTASSSYAVAIGYQAKASGAASFAAQGGTASGSYSFAFSGGTASGANSTAWNYGTAGGNNSTAWNNGTASDKSSTAWNGGIASGDNSTAWNYGAANGNNSTAWNNGNASKEGATAWNYGAANGNNSTAWNYGTAQSYLETSFGQFVDTAATKDIDLWVATDRLLTIGNGTGVGSESNALVMLKNGNTTVSGEWNFEEAPIIGASSEVASSDNVGKIRYSSDANNSYCEMVMQTGASTYAWVVIKTNTW